MLFVGPFMGMGVARTPLRNLNRSGTFLSRGQLIGFITNLFRVRNLMTLIIQVHLPD